MDNTNKESYGLNPEHKFNKPPEKGEFRAELMMKELYNFYYNEDKPSPKKTREPSIKHNVWEEDGQRYSSWTIDTGSSVMITGDAGMEQLSKAMKKDAMKEWNITEINDKPDI